MLSKSDTDITTAIENLMRFEISAVFFVPTETALTKSIMDAHESLRVFLQREGIHDFNLQKQGPSHKRELPITLFSGGGTWESKISMYRPETKSGDPRFWISKLAQHSRAWNLWAIWVSKASGLIAVNCSDQNFLGDSSNPASELGSFLQSEKSANASPASSELLSKLLEINLLGYVENLRKGDTGVGFTLESLLGIQANSSRNPDFKGIEIKAKRLSQSNRVNLFSQVPLWKKSACKNGKELVTRFGYFDETRNRQALYTTVTSVPNAQSLYFAVEPEDDGLYARKLLSGRNFEEVVQWELSRLERELGKKHAETFWVSAKKRTNTLGREEFHYTEVTHTKSPIVEYFGPLVETGIITMDFTIHLKPTGQTRDHGYLFKIRPDKLELLFPPPENYDLGALNKK